MKKCNGAGNLKTDMMFGDSLVVKKGSIISSKNARVDITVCEMHLSEYQERISDVGCEKEGCLARVLLVKVGENFAREFSDHIGIRILNETETQKATSSKNRTDMDGAEQGLLSKEKTPVVGPPEATHVLSADGVVLIKDDDENTMGINVGLKQPDVQSTQPCAIPSEQETTSTATDNLKTRAVEAKKRDKPDASSNKVRFQDPAHTEDAGTSSELEEYQLEKIWGNRGSERRLSLDTASSGNSRHNASDSGRVERSQKSATGKKARKQREKSVSTSDSSSSPTSEISASQESRKSRKSESRRSIDRASRNADNVPEFTKRPTTKATRPPVRMQVGSEVFTGKRSKWDKMAGAMREITENRNKKDENPKATKMQKFVTFAMRGFGNFTHKLAVARYGDDMIASVKRCINARGNTLIAAGIRFPIAYRLLKAAVKVDFGTINTGKEVEGSTTLADFPFWPKEKLERYRLGTEKDDIP